MTYLMVNAHVKDKIVSIQIQNLPWINCQDRALSKMRVPETSIRDS